ncbi:hypothetical protein [Wolbachia endosymbiont of Drosophila tsacasi]|uniref:hypothetical protein n=1 Tax=Wolbachia endosymbiont of Drosophila tsacasi TaxID=3002579 RepID=UPI0023A9A935|nr:hypothetical protein [Wolbachia endosymbiont of Drosophila tsacasi]MDE5062349.1 hypothetical protein [Wolbachia endosymbiont of Drosophila tsacasi]
MGVDEYKNHGWIFSFKYKGTTASIYRKGLSEEEKFQIIQRVKNSGLDEYKDNGWMFSFKYKGTTASIYRKDLSEEERFQIIKDIKNSYESLVSECDGLGNENTALSIYFDENKEISRMFFRNPDKNISKWLDKTLISRSKPEQDVDDTAGKEPEPESAEEDTQQPSNFLSNIFSAIKSVIDSISSFFSWLFGSKEEKSDDNLSLFKLDANELGHDVRDHLSDNYNHYNSSDGLM